jgi:hypothetical protein
MKVSREEKKQLSTKKNFFFFIENNLIAWTKDQNLINFPLDSQYTSIKDITNKLGDDTTDLPTRISHLNSQQSNTNINLLQHQSITSASSRKSSFSEYNYGTPPNLHIGIQALLLNQSLINSSATEPIYQHSQLNYNPQSKSTTRMAEIIPYPKCFCAKFSGLPRKFHHLDQSENIKLFLS